ncbi:Desert hedgehog protein [Seminavis robusta]|uniref:Desert hedgehog protein n=1 Tax=Seminavis robusta TaxID=568900 RepID=A0A9N8HB12_9STRA|nr:Desert hedgehog protein [Seminavis robusta]|eukprot:Sro318_g116010.1 Desert hedgehog protein (642) ;mRNA; r:50775-52700
MSFNANNPETIKDGASIPSMNDQKYSKDGTRKRLSVRSSQFDRGNKGFLDDEEQLLVKYDVNGDGKIDAGELFNIVSDLKKEHGKKKNLKKGLGLSLVAILLLLTMSFGLVWAVVALTKEVAVDSHGHLVDSHTGNVVETRPEASLIFLKADSGVARRFLVRKLQDSVGGGLDRSDDLDGEGRQLLGTAPKNGVHTAYRRFQENSEHCNAVVTVDGVEYTRPLNLAGISRREEDSDRRELGGGGGGNRPRKLLYQGIYMESNPDQEFRLDCDDEEDDCSVFSVGRFQPGSSSGRRLSQIEADQCEDDDDCNGDFTCKSIWGDKHCTCNEDTDCDYLLESGGAHYSYRDYTNVDAQCPSSYVCRTYYDCFSASMTTMTPEGPKKMDELKINDLVLTSSGKFQKVYAWLHRTPEKLAASQARESAYLQIVTDSGNKIEMTPKHMIYINDQQYPVEAGHVKVGDYLSLMEPGHATTIKTAKVTAITTVKLMGGFSPATEDGTIVVNGLLASSYSNPRYTDNEYVLVAGKPLMHRQAFTHLITSPLRLLCIHVSSSFCEVDMDEEAFLPFSKGVDKLYVASANAGVVDTVLMLTGFTGMLAHGIELFFKTFGLPLMASGCVLALINVVAPFNFKMQIVNKSKKVD